jgi:hypothetical protein
LSFNDRRNATRFGLKLPVIIRWKDGDEMREATTVSQDVSSSGIYFLLPEGIKDGTYVEVEMTLPSQITLAEAVRVRSLGRIQRCKEEGTNTGMAASISKYEFLADGNALPLKVDPSDDAKT